MEDRKEEKDSATEFGTAVGKLITPVLKILWISGIAFYCSSKNQPVLGLVCVTIWVMQYSANDMLGDILVELKKLNSRNEPK